jgi:tRNA (guanine-N7-)-methyltransferase
VTLDDIQSSEKHKQKEWYRLTTVIRLTTTAATNDAPLSLFTESDNEFNAVDRCVCRTAPVDRNMRRVLSFERSFHKSVAMSIFLGSLAWTASRTGTRYTSKRTITNLIPSVVAFSAPPTNRQVSTQPVDNKEDKRDDGDGNDDQKYTPWNHPNLSERSKGPKTFRSRQHVNPLASKFQQPTVLSQDWPRDVFSDLLRPFFLDVGCSRGGFLLDIATQRPHDYNYLGLEIRPIIVHQAQERLANRPHLQGHLDFVGCNANVDLDRLLTLLSDASADSNTETSTNSKSFNLQMVCIQFPDPHFKAKHAKRRVATPELVETLARFMPPGATVFLQSDVQPVLDEMRLQFRDQSQYFVDSLESLEEYLNDNILGIPTERELSVLNQDLPVYRALFTRTDQAVLL